MAGCYVPVSLSRRIVTDILYAAGQLTHATIEKHMSLAPVVAARAAAASRPSWCAIFTKALAATFAEHPALRRAYLTRPWHRMYEYDENIAGIVIERAWRDESAIFLARVPSPEKMPLLELDAAIRRFKDRPIEKVSSFRGALRMAALPGPLRRLLWRVVMNWMPRARAKLLGTFGVSVTAGMGATGLFVPAPWTFTMHYDIFTPAGTIDVRFTFDHRVADGGHIAPAMADMERILLGPICAELRALAPAAAA
jgi:hypothetical protein